MFSSDGESFGYTQYNLYYYQQNQGPPIVDKKSRLIAAVVQDQVEILQDLLNPEWYNITDASDYTLIQIAILCGKEKVFDYLISIPDFSINAANKRGETTLAIALDSIIPCDSSMSEHFAYELLTKGVSIDVVYPKGNTPLHSAILRHYKKVPILLIEKGVDVNVRNDSGYTPLELAVEMLVDPTEVVLALLTNGATLSVCEFERSILRNITASCFLQEILFLYVFDECSRLEVGFDVILKLAKINSPLFFELIKFPVKVKVIDRPYPLPYFRSLCLLNIECLKIILEKFSKQIRQVLAKCIKSMPLTAITDETNFMENLSLMLEDNISPVVISYFSALFGSNLYQRQVLQKLNKSRLTEFYCFLLSYGFIINEWDLHFVYKKFGYCELFKIFLHMDINMGFIGVRDILPTLIYDVTVNLDQILQNQDKYSKNNVREVCNYFHYSRLKEICSEVQQNLSQVPLLTELSRDTFREYFIELFEIKTSRKFYTLLNCLPISRDYKKIISYETKLYQNNY